MRYTVDYVEHSSAWLEVDIPDNADPEQWMREHWELVREQLEKDGSELEITPVRTITEQEDSPAVTVPPYRRKETERPVTTKKGTWKWNASKPSI